MNKYILDFIDSVREYVTMEYSSQHTEALSNNSLYDFIGSYYLGGNNVPDTARYVVDFLKSKNQYETKQKSQN